MDRGEILNEKSRYKSWVNSNSSGDIISAVIISVECIIASAVILVNILN